jgi:hypothetical protein
MSWWDTGEGDDVIGDRPADILTSALAAIADSGDERPSLAALLAGLGAALSEPEHPVIITADTEAGPVQGVGEEAQAEGARLLPRLREALEEVKAAYQDRWERDPRPSEVAHAAAFVLGPSPERYLRAPEAEGLELNALYAEVGKPV